MHKLNYVILSSLVVAHARDIDQQPQLRYLRRDSPFANITTTSTTTSINTTTQSTITTTSTFITSTASTTSLNTDHLASWDSPIESATSSQQGYPPPYSNASTTDPTCVGFATYFDSVPPTVFVTVTEGFDVTVTAANVSVTVSETLITPLPACGTTIMSAERSSMIAGGSSEGATLTKSAKSSPAQPPGSRTQNQPQFATFTPPDATVPQEFSTAMSDDLGHSATLPYSSVPYTSTVIVTKKTPVTVVVPPTTSPGVIFQIPQSTENGAQNTAPSAPKLTSDPGAGRSDSNNNNAPTSIAKTTNGNNPSQNSEQRTASTSVGLGDIIASIIFSGYSKPTNEAARSTTVNGVPIVVLPSTVVIGDQSFAVPTSRTSVQVNGVGFELGPSEIVAPSATITIPPPQQAQMMTITPRPTSTTVALGDGFTLIVGQTVAVIAGTTYRVGQGAPATTITVDGTTISVGSNGVGLPRTIVSPVGATASGYVIYTVNGITFSVDDNEAVISGTTYRIGSNAPQMTTVIGSETVSFGSNGIGLRSTTIAPTVVPSGSATAGARSTSSASATGGTSSENAATPVRLRIPFSELLGRYLIVMCAVYNLLS